VDTIALALLVVKAYATDGLSVRAVDATKSENVASLGTQHNMLIETVWYLIVRLDWLRAGCWGFPEEHCRTR